MRLTTLKRWSRIGCDRQSLFVLAGGYEFLSDREAEPIAVKMMSFGFQAFVLHYSIKPHVYPLALQELAASVQLIRQNHSQWHVDPEKIIVAGLFGWWAFSSKFGRILARRLFNRNIVRSQSRMAPKWVVAKLSGSFKR